MDTLKFYDAKQYKEFESHSIKLPLKPSVCEITGKRNKYTNKIIAM